MKTYIHVASFSKVTGGGMVSQKGAGPRFVGVVMKKDASSKFPANIIVKRLSSKAFNAKEEAIQHAEQWIVKNT